MQKKFRGAVALTAALLVGVLGACAPTGAGLLPVSAGRPATTPAPLQITTNLPEGATDVPVDTLVTVAASAGKLAQVTVTAAGATPSATPSAGAKQKGEEVSQSISGAMRSDGTWTATERLEPGTVYTVTASGTNASGQESTTTSTFTTAELTLKQQIHVSMVNQSGSTYGVAMPVVVQFDLPVSDRAAFEKQLSITTTPVQQGSWGWVSDREVQWRSATYLQPGTKVSVKADLNGVNAGDGRYGQNSASADFAIGRSRVTKVDLAAKQLTQLVDGQQVLSIPVSGGRPDSQTRSGTKVVMEKLAQTRMASETVGIANDSSDGYDLQVKYAIRMTTSGEFLHAAPWNAANFGRKNASHGCVGMSTANAKALFNTVQVGDPIVVTGTNRALDAGNGWTAWNESWEKWQTRSALS